MRNCPVCGTPAKDKQDDQVALWGFGVHDAKTDSRKTVDKTISELVILHKDCLLSYIEGAFIDCKFQAKQKR